MVGISYRDVPVCSGAIIKIYVVLTAASPMRYHNINHGRVTDSLKAHVIYREWDKSVAIEVESNYFQTKFFNHSTEAFEKSGIYAPVHDLACLALTRQLPIDASALSVRHPIRKHRSIKEVFKSTGVFTIVGHGYADRLHVQQNIQLEAVDYLVDDVLVDCDEWIPRSWGYFVCLLNVDNFVGISSGAALLHNGVFVAVGSFSLTRGSETILLLTDLRKYKSFHLFRDEYNGTQKQTMW
ncbi:unnamed protein product [Arctia plantaginis]|uniref:Peptidase S1 domain-containing protein n=1 Tax=Arctia plantaginis TaxID=874455 RepID=A0A8S1A114_ARCPL|nr:unnamed protein product [Arctia plantaginis]